MPLIAVQLLSFVCVAQVQAEPVLSPERLYHGVGQPIMIAVQPQRTLGNFALAMMDHDGKLLADPASVRPGRVDLAGVMPSVSTLRRAAFLQLMDGTEPLGSALVLQPMLSRMVPVAG